MVHFWSNVGYEERYLRCSHTTMCEQNATKAKFVAQRIRKMQHVGRMETAGKVSQLHYLFWVTFIGLDEF